MDNAYSAALILSGPENVLWRLIGTLNFVFSPRACLRLTRVLQRRADLFRYYRSSGTLKPRREGGGGGVPMCSRFFCRPARKHYLLRLSLWFTDQRWNVHYFHIWNWILGYRSTDNVWLIMAINESRSPFSESISPWCNARGKCAKHTNKLRHAEHPLASEMSRATTWCKGRMMLQVFIDINNIQWKLVWD
jgi:hypothetical protein